MGAGRIEQNGGALRLFVVDDQEVVRRGVRDLVNAAGGLLVVGEAATAGRGVGAGARGPADRAGELPSRLPDLECLMLTSYPR